jgi:thioredoxin-related protein
MLQQKKVAELQDLGKELAHIEKFKIPLVVLLSRSDCHFCHEVRTNYLSPLTRTFSEKKLAIRELQTDVVKTLIGNDGKTITVNDLLKLLKVNFFPTVVFIDHQLRMLSEPLIGLNQSGFYGFYLDQRIEMAIKNAA